AWGTAELIRWSTTARRLPSPSRQVLWLALGLAALAATIPVYLYLSEPVFIDSLRLLTLKSRFFNVKPAEPAVLNFSERLLWNFDERSPNNIQIAAFFPVVIPFAVAAILAALPLESLRTQLKRWCVLIHPIHYLTAATCAAFIFFENAYLAAAFFAAVFSGCVLWFWLRNSNRLTARGGVAVLTALLILPSMLTLFFNGAPLAPASLLDAMKTPAAFLAAAAVATCLLLLPLIFLGKVQFGKHFPRCFVIITAIATLAAEFRFSPASNQGGNSDTASLTRWMSSENVENVRFASFPSLSPLIESYCGAGALFQRLPRTPSKIDVYRKFLELMYKGDEMALSEFLAKHEVRYLIFDSATALSKSLYAPRYLADAPVIQPNSPVGMMNSAVGREKLKCLYEVKSNLPDQDISKRFIIFKVVSRKNRSDALKWAYESERLSREGDNALAARLAKSAIFADPNCLPAEIMYRKLFRKPPRIRLRGY
ncbi:MAG: hypothetical protein KAG97_11970, partial [Victivallales bacterium]|nr:hypothetical protein [Victivallales bacterium]